MCLHPPFFFDVDIPEQNPFSEKDCAGQRWTAYRSVQIRVIVGRSNGKQCDWSRDR